MGKEGELWDDSALLNAFDDAMSKYKKMHPKKIKDNSSNGEAFDASVSQEIHGEERDTEEKNNVISNSLASSGEAKNLQPDQEDQCEPSVNSLSGLEKLAVDGNSESQNADGYNQLLNQYYELEWKRQTILQQLQQFGGYNYQASADGYGSSQQLGSCYTSHDHSFATGQPPVATVVCSCCPYASHCSAAPCTSCSCCSKMCDDSCALTCHAKSSPPTDGEIVKTAMAAAEKAISSIKSMEPTNSSTEGRGKDDVEGIAQSMSSETDLSLVLNAWYSAGFYTGKYLMEKSKKGK